MTKLKPGQALIRETATLERGDPLIIDAGNPKFLEMWPKGKRESVTVPWDAIYDLGRKLKARRGGG